MLRAGGLPLHYARLQSLRNFVDRLSRVSADIEAIAALFLRHTKYVADVRSCWLLGSWKVELPVADTPMFELHHGQQGARVLSFDALDPWTQACFTGATQVWTQRDADPSTPHAAAPDALAGPVLELLELGLDGERHARLLASSSAPLTKIERELLSSMARLTANTIAALLSEREISTSLARRNAQLLGLVDELSTMILPVWEDVLVMPLVGTLDDERSAQIQTRLLGAVAHDRGRHVIIDLTGLSSIDAQASAHLSRLLRALELLGARTYVAGLKPELARSIVPDGRWSARTFYRNLEHALRACLAQRDR